MFTSNQLDGDGLGFDLFTVKLQIINCLDEFGFELIC